MYFLGADISKDDGIYSRYVIKLEKGIHHVTFKVIGENGKVWSKEESLDINDLHGREYSVLYIVILCEITLNIM